MEQTEKPKQNEVSPEVLAMLKEKGLKPKEGTEQPQQPESQITSDDIQNYINNKKISKNDSNKNNHSERPIKN